MSQVALFKRLQAPLKNTRWSWGSIRAADNVIFLRVWQDKSKQFGGKVVVQLSHNDDYKDDLEDLGHVERLAHIEMIGNGALCYLITCRAVDVNDVPRKVKGFNDRVVFPGGKLVEIEGETWIEMSPGIAVEDALPKVAAT
jgi:hypothetical protein